MQKLAIDTLIVPRWLAPVVPQGQVLTDCALAIHDGRIIDICTARSACERYQPEHRIELPRHLLTPGLINAHGHAAMALLRGFADDLPLKTWLEQHIWPAEGQHVSYDFVRDGTRLAAAEMLSGGTSCFSDMYFFPEAVAEVAHASGLRAQICFPILEFPTPWADTVDTAFSKGLKLFDEYRNHSRIQIAFGPHAPYTVGDEALSRTATLAAELDAAIQIHVHETAGEVNDALANSGQRPLTRLAALGLLGPRTQCVHMTQVNKDDQALMGQWGAHVVHCPESNMKLASGICPVAPLLAAGINVALGTDGPASNNDLSLAGEMKTAALLAKVSSGDPAVLDAHSCLRMATLNGARALGIEGLVGSLEKGKQADIAAFDLGDLACEPCFDPVSLLVYSDNAKRASHVWVDGQLLLDDHRLTTLDEQQIRQASQRWQAAIAGKPQD